MQSKFSIRRSILVILAVFGAVTVALLAAKGLKIWPIEPVAVNPAAQAENALKTVPVPVARPGTDVDESIVALKRERGVDPSPLESSPVKPASTRDSLEKDTRAEKDGSGILPAGKNEPEKQRDKERESDRDREREKGEKKERREINGEEDDDDRPAEGGPDEAAQFRTLQMQDDDGKIPIDGFQKAREQVDQMRARQEKRAIARGKTEGQQIAGINPGQWAWLGPGNIGGRVRTIVIDPTNANRMFIGSASGGIWQSINAGASWAPVNDFMSNLAVSTMVMDPADPTILYAGTGESFAASLGPFEGEGFSPGGQRGDGVFKSTNRGVTWTQLPSTNTANATVCPTAGIGCAWSYVNRLAISPDDTTILAANIGGIYRSTDGGTTWTLATAGTRGYLDVDFDPTNSQKAVASGIGAFPSVFSTNGGATWQSAAYSPPINAATLGGSTGRIEIAYAPSNPTIVYSMVDATQGTGSPPPVGSLVKGNLYKSVDGGATFNRVNGSNPGNTLLGGQGNYGNIIWVNPNDPNFLLVGGVNMFKSIDGGSNWTQVADGQNGSAHADHHMIVADPGFNNTANKKVYFSNDGGIFRADDVSSVSLTSGWTNLNNSLGITQFYGAAVNSAGIIAGGTQDNGTLRYSGDAQSWTKMFGGDGGYTVADPIDNNYFYGEYTNLGIVRSTDGGISSGYIFCDNVTYPIGSGIPNPCTSPAQGIRDSFNGANFIAPILLDPGEPNRLYGGGLSLWRSNDAKAPGVPTWSAVKPPSPDRRPATLGNPNPISAIAVSKNNSDLVIIGHNDGQIFLTFDGTSAAPTWSRIDAGIPATRFVTRIVVDETKGPNWIYVTLGGFAADNIYRSTDLGASWTDITGTGATGLPNVPVRDLAISPANPLNIYAATEIGIFASENAGTSWGLPQDGPANVPVDQLIWINGNLGAVTHGRGVYKTNLPVYSLPVCVSNGPCACFGRWNCPCTWGSNTIPTADSDVIISCPITVTASAPSERTAKNMVVTSFLFLETDMGVTGDVYSRGAIKSINGMFANFGGRNIVNYKNPDTFNNGGEIVIAGNLTATGDLTNSGSGVITAQTVSAANLTTNPGSAVTMTTLNVGGNVDNFGLVQATAAVNVKGNINNTGTLKGTNLVPTAPATLIKTYSGSGVWNFNAFSIPSGYKIKLGSNLTFDIPSVSNGGNLDFSDKTLNFKGTSFQGVGTVAGTGILRFVPTTGASVFNANGPGVTIASGTVEYQSGGTVSGPFTIDAGATFAMNTGGTLLAQGDVINNGSILKTGANPQFVFNGTNFINNGSVGAIDFFTFNDGNGPAAQTLKGAGSWSPTNVQVGSSSPTSTLTLGSNVTMSTNQFIIANGSKLDVFIYDLIMTGQTNNFRGKIAGGQFGNLKIKPVSGTPILGSALNVDPPMEIVSGTAKANGLTTNSNLTIDSGATLSLMTGGVVANGDVINNGTINLFSTPSSLTFNGTNFTNNGLISTANINFANFFGPTLNQNLLGNGLWTGNPRLLIDALSNTTLGSDVTYNGTNLYVEGHMNTGAFTLSVPCTTLWSGAGEVIGNIRRTNLSACPGAAFAFGNPFTTIQFTSGVPPSDILVNVLGGAPAGFPNAALRTYLITPTGGSGYTATLRLHYLDSELNGNAESSLQLWRNSGTNWTPQGVTSRDTTQNWVEYNGVTAFSPWTVAGAGLSLSGRVLNSGGRGITNTNVSVSGATLTTPRSIITGRNGAFRFDGLQAGATYVVTVSGRRYTFATPSRTVTLADNVSNFDFTSQ